MVMLDTLAIARGLQAAGFSDKQAEALAGAVRQAAGMPDISNLATKGDVRVAAAEIKADVLKWVFAMIVGSTLINVGTLIALVKMFGHQ